MLVLVLFVALLHGPQVVTMDTGALYPFGDNPTDEKTKTLPYTFSLSTSNHNPWGISVTQFTVFPAKGFMERAGVKVRFWDGELADMSANPNTHQYYKRTNSQEYLERIKNDVTEAFGNVWPYTDFTPVEVDIITFVNFTYLGGDETTKTNTVQFVTSYSTTGETYWMLNFGDIGWWDLNGTYPNVGFAYDFPDTSGEGVRFELPGSGTKDMEKILKTGNSQVNGRWIVSPMGPYPNLLHVPRAFVVASRANTDDSEIRAVCLPGYGGSMCQIELDGCSSSPCEHGQCSNNMGQYTCTCNEGYIGRNCDTMANSTCTECPPCPNTNGASTVKSQIWLQYTVLYFCTYGLDWRRH